MVSISQLVHYTHDVAKQVLLEARERSRKTANIKAFIADNALTHLASYIMQPPPPELLNLSLSVFANLLSDEDAKRQINREQIQGLIRLLDETTADEDFDGTQEVQIEMKGRLIRALTNVAQGSAANRDILVENGAFKSIGAATLSEENPDLYEVACRALRIIPSDAVQRKLAATTCAEIPAKALLMDRKIARSAVRAVSNLSKAINPHLTSSLLHYDGKPIKVLLRAITSRTISTRQDALSAVLRLTQRVGALRPKICSYGGLQLFKANLEKTGGGYTRFGIPFLRSICCCIREAINRKKVREIGCLRNFSKILEKPITSETKPLAEGDEWILMAKAIVLTSLTNFYYDDEGITEMISLDFASSIATLLPETLIDIAESPDAPTDYDHQIAASSDLPTAFNKVDLVAPLTAPQNSVQKMKRLQSSSSSDESFESGLSPPSSPVRRAFKRRKRSHRTWSSSSDESLGTPGLPASRDRLSAIEASPDRSRSASPLSILPTPPPTPNHEPTQTPPVQEKVSNKLTQEEAAITILNRFMMVKPNETIEQLSKPEVIIAIFSYISKGGQLNWIIQKIMESIISKGKFSNLLIANFMTVLAKTIEDRYTLDLPEDKKDDLLCNITAKWIEEFVVASREHIFTIDAWLEAGEDDQQLAVARTIPFLLSDESNWLHLPASFDILKDNIDEHSFRSILAFCTEALKKIPRIADNSESHNSESLMIGKDYDDKRTVTVKLADCSVTVSRRRLEEISPMFQAMLHHADSAQFTESTDLIQLPTFDSEIVSFVLGVSKTKPKDPISVDLFCQQYLIEENIRQKIQSALWDSIKKGLEDGENESLLIHVSENSNSEQLLPWPVRVVEHLVDFSNRSFFKRFFFSQSDHVFNILNYLLRVSSPTSTS
ncbi:Oidioi.mRNA.OKI2018_I69.chr1.g2080.t1.cds [Oikopleura dioica]|uniref:Oidioi.mRNA.OKI2018_I69.chr1.g2080.t1.cds n=1 Tax=Oikopleura dioica TaxID=34765 RepID=A0ABN7SRP1_OIKDI|nr:Oidioi.mRNA.OKI2018_I69.chr1.g2080.t1.cds [Oikopleura dioica]